MVDPQGPSNQRRRRMANWLTRAFFRRSATPGAMPVSSRVATWVGIVSASIGGFMGLDTYRADVSKKVDQSVEKTFDLIHRFNEPSLVQTRQRVLSYVNARRYCDSRWISRELTDYDYVTVLDFFDLAHACVEAQLCDQATAQKFFSPYANYQWPILQTVVANLQNEEQSLRADDGFSVGIATFAIDPVDAPPCDGNF